LSSRLTVRGARALSECHHTDLRGQAERGKDRRLSKVPWASKPPLEVPCRSLP
jgi:hypothetical protein